MDAFDVLGLAPALELDLAQLEQRYRDLSRTLHPDKFVNAASSERRAAMGRALSVNEAYRLLRDELARTELVFRRLGLKDSDEQTTADPELLMEVMELREELAGARKQRDLTRARRLALDVHERQEAARGALRHAHALLSAGPDEVSRERAARLLSRLRYYRRFQDEAAAIEDDLGEA